MPDRPSHDWLYYRIYLPGIEHADHALETVVRPGIAWTRAELPGLRWFFLRFADPTGVHLRVRLRVGLAELPAVERWWDARLTEAAPVRWGKFVYGPETAKFGAGDGIRLAERLFQLGSDTALACLGERHRRLRSAYGAATLILLLAGLPAAQRPGFLHQYAWYWSGGPARRHAGPPADGAGRTERAARFVGHADEVLADPATRTTLADYQARFWAELTSDRRRLVRRSDFFLLFHHAHLMNNRLGVYPVVEARIARLLWAAGQAGITPKDWS